MNIWRASFIPIALRVLPLLGQSYLVAQAAAECPSGPHALYSQRTTPWDGRPLALASPDGRKSVRVGWAKDLENPDETGLDFTVRASGKEFTTRLAGHDAEVLWSPDSAAFAVTQTAGGGGFGIRAYVFFVDSTGLQKIDISAPVARAFRVPGRCEIKVASNVGVIDWVRDSHRILVAAEVAPVSVCECNGSFSVYEVSLPAATLGRVYSQSHAKRELWDLLGCELRDARACYQR